jgi:hypothetical protein
MRVCAGQCADIVEVLNEKTDGSGRDYVARGLRNLQKLGFTGSVQN